MTVTFKPSAAFSDGQPVCALSVVDALADIATGDDAYTAGSLWQAKWEPSVFRASYKDNDTITGPVTVTWTWTCIETTTDPVTVLDSFGGSSSIAAAAARSTATTTTTVTAPGAGWAKLAELHDLFVSVNVGGGDASKVALVKAILNVNTITSAAVGTPVVTVLQPPPTIPRGIRPRVLWAFDHPSGYAQAEYRVKVFDGAPSPDADDDPTPLYDSATQSSAWSEHVIADELDWTAGLRVYVKARASGGTWASWAYTTVTSEPTVTSSAPTVTASSDPVPTLTVTLTPQFASSGLDSVLVRGYHADATADPDLDDPDVEVAGEVTWGPNLHPDPSFDGAAANVTVVSGATVAATSSQWRDPRLYELTRNRPALTSNLTGNPDRVSKDRTITQRARSGARALSITIGGGTDGAFTYSGVDTPRASHYRVSGWVWAPAGTAYSWGVRSVQTDLTTVIATTTASATGTANWQRHEATVCPGSTGDCRVGFYLTSTATTGTALYLDDVEIFEGRLPTLACTDPLPNAIATYWHCRATALSGLATDWGTSSTTPSYTSPPTASAASATADTTNHRVTISATRASGYTGDARLEVQRSHDGRWVDVYGSGSSTWALNTTGASVTVYDRAAPSQSSPSYRYRLVGYANAAQPKPGTWTSLSTVGTLGAQNWLRDPSSPSDDLRISLQVQGLGLAADTDADVKRPLGATYPTTATTRASGQRISATVKVAGADRTALAGLLAADRTLLLQAAFGGQWWVRAASPAQTVALLTPGRASSATDFVTLTFTEVDQPEA